MALQPPRLARQNAYTPPPKLIFSNNLIYFIRELKRKQARRHLLKNYKALIIKAMLNMMKDKLIKSLLLVGLLPEDHPQTPLGQAVNQVVNCSRGLMSPLGRVLRY
tara:strand:- start:1585 stop:1902 length:318 start_codon:yes stop_codon:yes gene_type:complete